MLKIQQNKGNIYRTFIYNKIDTKTLCDMGICLPWSWCYYRMYTCEINPVVLLSTFCTRQRTRAKTYNMKANSTTLCWQMLFDLVPNWRLRPADLPVGFYCPEGTAYEWRACPLGTYSPDSGLSELSQCRECDGGHYCSYQNAIAVSGQCSPGYYCIRGNTSPQPLTLSPGTMKMSDAAVRGISRIPMFSA